ncbi:MAG: hypothetical protein WC479_05790 [Candidatus Izemoplasmatales bacterium]
MDKVKYVNKFIPFGDMIPVAYYEVDKKTKKREVKIIMELNSVSFNYQVGSRGSEVLDKNTLDKVEARLKANKYDCEKTAGDLLAEGMQISAKKCEYIRNSISYAINIAGLLNSGKIDEAKKFYNFCMEKKKYTKPYILAILQASNTPVKNLDKLTA